MRILDGVGNKIAEQDGVGAHNANSNVLTVNGLSHAWFKKINVQLNGENMFRWKHVYPLRGHQNETFISPNSERKFSQYEWF